MRRARQGSCAALDGVVDDNAPVEGLETPNSEALEKDTTQLYSCGA